jgi:hypothetical protein
VLIGWLGAFLLHFSFLCYFFWRNFPLFCLAFEHSLSASSSRRYFFRVPENYIGPAAAGQLRAVLWEAYGAHGRCPGMLG